MTTYPKNTACHTETEADLKDRLRRDFWNLWGPIRGTVPHSTERELQIADHAAWLMFRAMRSLS